MHACGLAQIEKNCPPLSLLQRLLFNNNEFELQA